MSLYEPHLSTGSGIPDSDHGGLVKVAGGFCTACMLVFIALRLLIHWPWHSLFGKDDLAGVVASMIALVQTIVALLAVSKGLGRKPDTISHSSLIAAEKMIYASDLLFLLSLFLGKLVITVFFQRLSSMVRQSKVAMALSIATCIFGAASILMIAIPRPHFAPWSYGPLTAESMVARWIAVTVMINLLEVGFLAFPIFLVWGLQMKRSHKAIVILGFWSRLPLIPVSILRLLRLSSSLHSTAFIFEYASTEIFTQVEMAYTLIAATIPCLRIFLISANTNLLPGDLTVRMGSTTGSPHYRSSWRTKASEMHSRTRRPKGFEGIELSSNARGQNISQANAASDVGSLASDCSQRAIVIRQTVDVQYFKSEVA